LVQVAWVVGWEYIRTGPRELQDRQAQSQSLEQLILHLVAVAVAA
jgi:hypothetical protein